jgi:hypothetical protein
VPIDFPSSPAVDDTYTYSGRTWKYNGEGWVVQAESVLNDDEVALHIKLVSEVFG